MPGPPFPRVPASDPPSRTLGAAGARLTSLRALLPPRPLPTARRRCEGPAPVPGPSCRGLGRRRWELVLLQRERGGHPLVPQDGAGASVAGPVVELLSSGDRVVFHFSLMPPPPLVFTSLSHLRLWGLMTLFLLPSWRLPFFAANPLASRRQYYFCVYLAQHLSGRAGRLTLYE